jgi:hypothetical protein
MPTTRIEISLTDFIDFVNKTGSLKLTHVRQIKNRPEYEPYADFYKMIREKIQSVHQLDQGKSELDNLLNSLTDEKKKKAYPLIIDGYKKFWGRKKPIWFKPPSKIWKIGDLEIKINPELGLKIGDNNYVIKLYFKEDKISRHQIDQILTLMENELRSKVKIEEMKFSILDIRKSKHYIQKDSSVELMPLLHGEARSFIEIWKGID